MDNISEEATPSEMKPIQIQQQFGKTIKEEDDDNIFGVFLKKGSDNDQEDEMFLFGVGGPA